MVLACSLYVFNVTKMNVSQNVVTERRREISRKGREIFVLSERTLGWTPLTSFTEFSKSLESSDFRSGILRYLLGLYRKAETWIGQPWHGVPARRYGGRG